MKEKRSDNHNEALKFRVAIGEESQIYNWQL